MKNKVSTSEVTDGEATLWWKHGVLYQIYPRSFADSNGDGVGDLAGIIAHLDHLVWLGVQGIWISPCFLSPMADFGYDVADYCQIDPVFGDLATMDTLLEKAHARGLKVLLDWVPNHTSNEHAWFQNALTATTADKRDWYIWRDPAPGGGPPNNWISVFGGSAWELDEASGQYFLHSYLKEQPDLNWRNPKVEAAMHDVLRFWFDRGVDGFRIDVIHRIGKHPALKDNPAATEKPPYTVSPAWDAQAHIHDEDDPIVHTFLERIRAVVDEYDERALVGEVWIFDPDKVAAYYGDGDQLHLAFNFSFLDTAWSAAAFQAEIEHAERMIPEVGWPTWVLSNHDLPRAATRYAHDAVDDERLKVAAAMLFTLRGTPWLYYGEEIGMRDVTVPEELWQDPVSRSLGAHANRDPCRTPMRWSSESMAGFTNANKAWLPVGPIGDRNVAAQKDDESSLLHAVRSLIDLRRRHQVLQMGSLSWLSGPANVLAFARHHGGTDAQVFLNFSDVKVTIEMEPSVLADVAEIYSSKGTRLDLEKSVELHGQEALILILNPSDAVA